MALFFSGSRLWGEKECHPVDGGMLLLHFSFFFSDNIFL